MKNRKMVRKMSRVSVPKNSGSIANRVFKKLVVKTWDDYAISFSEVIRSTRFICQENERVAGASPTNMLWRSLIDGSF